MEWVNGYVDGRDLVLLRRDEQGNLIRHKQRAEFSAFYRIADLGHWEPKLRAMRHVREVRDEPNGMVRVCFKEYEARSLLVQGTRHAPSPLAGVPVFEGDVHPLARHFAESGDTIQIPRAVFLDIETDSRVPFAQKENARILTWVLVDSDDVVVAEGCLNENTHADEKRLLEELYEALEPFDLVLAWNGDGFDFPVISARSKFHRIRVDARRWLYMDALELFKRMNTASESGDEKASFSLNSVASRILDEAKDDLDGSQTWQYWEAGGESREKLLRYNVQDTRLLARLEKKTGFLALQFTLSEVCNVLPDTRGLNPIGQMDGFMFKLAKAEGKGHRFGTKFYNGDREHEQYEGAYVMEPETKGIEKMVHVCDFKSLYPSIIRTWNMSPDTLRNGPVNGPVGPGLCRATSGVSFANGEDGMLPAALAQMMHMRVEWANRKKKEIPGTPPWQDANRRSTAYKVAANSFYGAMGSIYSRFFDKRIAESVTKCGKWLILETIAAARQRRVDPNDPDSPKWRAIYADTDSCFVTGPTEEEFSAFVKWCNAELYPKLLEREGCAHRSVINLAFEKTFERLVMTTAKRYAGKYWAYDGTRATKDSKPEVRGLEYRRGDSARLARLMQSEVIDLLMKGDENPSTYTDVVERYLAIILQTELELDDVVITKGLSKAPDKYETKKKKDGSDGAGLVHVNVAKQMAERGMEVREGTKIPFVVTDAGPPQKAIWAGDYTGVEADRYFLWEVQVYPPTMRVLEAAFPDQTVWNTYARQRPKLGRGASKNNLDLFSFETKKLRSTFYAESEKEAEDTTMARKMIKTAPTEPTTPDPQQTSIEDALPLPTDNPPAKVPGKQLTDEEREGLAEFLTGKERPDERARAHGVEEISMEVFIPGEDMQALYRELEAALKITAGMHEHGNIVEELAQASGRFRVAHRLFVTARLARKSRDIVDNQVRSQLREQAAHVLHTEHKEGKRPKAPTVADIEAAVVNLYTDEVTAVEERSLRWNLTEDSLENLVRSWQARVEDLRAILQRSR